MTEGSFGRRGLDTIPAAQKQKIRDPDSRTPSTRSLPHHDEDHDEESRMPSWSSIAAVLNSKEHHGAKAVIGIFIMFVVFSVMSSGGKSTKPSSAVASSSSSSSSSDFIAFTKVDPEVRSGLVAMAAANGWWCGGTVSMLPDTWNSSVNQQVFAVTCDDGGSKVANYRLYRNPNNNTARLEER